MKVAIRRNAVQQKISVYVLPWALIEGGVISVFESAGRKFIGLFSLYSLSRTSLSTQ
jgi:hypothetical protein